MKVTGPARRRTQAERRAASEAALLSAAAELIAERGFERTSLRSIGARAGTSRERFELNVRAHFQPLPRAVPVMTITHPEPTKVIDW